MPVPGAPAGRGRCSPAWTEEIAYEALEDLASDMGCTQNGDCSPGRLCRVGHCMRDTSGADPCNNVVCNDNNPFTSDECVNGECVYTTILNEEIRKF